MTEGDEALDESAVDSAAGERIPLPPLLHSTTRAALQRLIASGVLLKRNHEADFLQIAGHQQVVKQILAELGLSLVIRHGYGMAATVRIGDLTQIDADGESPEDDIDDSGEDQAHRALLRVTRLKLLHSLVLMVLRAYFREREKAMDEHVIIDLEAIKDRVKPFWPLVHSESRSDRHFNAAIDQLERHAILLPVRDRRDAREISPVITLALNAERLQVMEAEFQRHLDVLEAASALEVKP